MKRHPRHRHRRGGRRRIGLRLRNAASRYWRSEPRLERRQVFERLLVALTIQRVKLGHVPFQAADNE